jgi:hypothetical protein
MCHVINYGPKGYMRERLLIFVVMQLAQRLNKLPAQGIGE